MSTNERDVQNLFAVLDGESNAPVTPLKTGPDPKTLNADPKTLFAELDRPFEVSSFAGLSSRQHFVEAIGQEILAPLRLFGVEPDPLPENVPGAPVARFAGTVVGLGIGFIPFLGVSSIALRTLGVVGKASKLPLLAQRLATSGLGFGLFEAGTSEDISEVPKEFAFGVALGVGGDLAFIGLGKAFVRVFGKGKVPPGATDLPEVDSDVIQLIKQTYPNSADDVAEQTAKVAMIQDVSAQWDDVIVNALQVRTATGVFNVPGIKDPKPFIAAVKRNTNDAAIGLHFDEATKTWKMMVAETRQGKGRLVEFLKHKRGLMTVDEAADLLRTGSKQDPKITVDLNQSESHFTVISEQGVIRMQAPEELVRIITKGSPQAAFMTAITHEYAHNFATRLAKESGKIINAGKKLLGAARMDVRDDIRLALGTILTDAETATLLPRLSGMKLKELRQLTGLNKELLDATLAAEHLRQGESVASLLKGRVGRNIKNKDYLGNGQELFARVVELMYVNPAMARKVAPRLSKAFGDAIVDQSSTMSQLFKNKDMINLDGLLSALWSQSDDAVRQYGIQGLNFAKKAKGSNKLGQFRQFGHYKGEGVQSPNGEWWEVHQIRQASKDINELALLNGKKKTRWGRKILAGEHYAVVRNQRTGKIKNSSFDGFSSPTLANFVEGNQAMQGLARTAMSKAMPRAVVTLRMVDEENAVRKAIINFKDFFRVKSLESYWRENARELQAFAEKRGILIGGHPGPDVKGVGAGQRQFIPSDPEARHRLLAEYLKSQGMKGLLINEDAIGRTTVGRGRIFGDQTLPTTGGGTRADQVDKNFISLFIADDAAIQLSDELISVGLEELQTVGMAIDGMFKEGSTRFIRLSNESRINSIIANNKIDPRDTAYFKELLRQVTAEDLAKTMDDDIVSALRNMDDGVALHGDGNSITDMVSRTKGNRAQQQANGDWTVTNDAGDVLVRGTEADVESFALKSVAPQSEKALDMGSQITTDLMPGNAGGVGPSKYMEQVQLESGKGFFGRLKDSMDVFLPMLTGFERFAQAAETGGFGPVWSKVFEPMEKGHQKVAALLNDVARKALGGKSINEFMVANIQKPASKLTDERQALISSAIEYMTAEEIAVSGGFMAKRGMNKIELNTSRRIQQLGTAHDIPRLLSLQNLGNRLLKNQTKFLERANRLINDPQTQKASPELVEQLTRLRDSSKQFNNIEEVFAEIGVTPAQRQTLALLSQKGGVNKFSKMVVMRHAQSDPLEAGFKTGRAQFIARHKMTADEIRIVNDTEKILDMGFKLSGMDAKRQIGAYWPQIRQLMPFGIDTTDDLFRKELPEFTNWVHERLRTGELDVYMRDPVIAPYKYLRSLFMNREIAPLLPEVNAVIQGVREGVYGVADTRIARIMESFVDEIIGRPHQSFKRLNEMVRTLLKTTGAPEAWVNNSRFGEAFVNALVSLSAGATIPFRLGLLLRNYYQVYQMVPATTGHRDFWTGVAKTIGWDGSKINVELRHKAFEMAEKAGAVQKHTIPIEASSQLFGGAGPNLLGRGVSSGPLGSLRQKYAYLIDKGFKWYQSADDWGRAVAFHAQRDRVKRFQNAFESKGMAWEDFAAKIKLLTYEPTEIQRFTQMYARGHKEEAIAFLGKQNARRTIFRYGHANHPAGWGGVSGRLFGQFGTWPVQYKDFMIEGMTRGTAGDRANFMATQLAANAGILAAGSLVGVNLASWLTFPSFQYVGGPYVGIVSDLVQMVGGSDRERAVAWQSLQYTINPLVDGRSMFIPGSYFAGDVLDAFEEKNIVEAFGINVAKPDPDRHWLGTLFMGN